MFDVENVKFVLVTNIIQLQASINKLYGNLVDSKRYLDKFIGFSVTLPNTYKSNDGYDERVLVSITHWDNYANNDEKLRFLNSEYKEFIHTLIKYKELSLREVETFLKYLQIYQSLCDNFNSKTTTGKGLYIILGVYFYCFAHNVVSGILKGSYSIDDIADAIGVTSIDYNKADSSLISIMFYGLHKESSGLSSRFFLPTDQQIKRQWDEALADSFLRKYIPNRSESVCSIIAEAIHKLRLE